ncbi:MAG: hypothetical protein LBH18_00260 [Spirochaetaceae bacterium]|jgi:hypothetical protein|nr:hypothetical protein [Spirochaetaceae bacterium]
MVELGAIHSVIYVNFTSSLRTNVKLPPITDDMNTILSLCADKLNMPAQRKKVMKLSSPAREFVCKIDIVNIHH